MAEFRMPLLGADMEHGTLVEWLVEPGHVVKRGDVVAIVETDKGNIDIEIWEDGIIDRLDVSPGSTVPVGSILATLRPSDAAPPAPAVPPRQLAPLPRTPEPLAPTPSRPLPVSPSEPARVRAAPAARQLARELGVDIGTIRGTGPSGVVTRKDIERAIGEAQRTSRGATPGAPAAPPMAAPPSRGPATEAMRRTIAAAMSRSKREIPHYYVATDVDLSRALSWLEMENLKRPISARILPVVLPLKAVALALREYPELNGFWVDGAFRPSPAVHLGCAISLRSGGLVAPAIHSTDRKSLPELMEGLADLIERARSGRLRSSELSDATVTVTSLGEQGTHTLYGVIYPPQAALVGLGRVTERPWAERGLLGVRPVLTATLSADHRVSDGLRGARFLSRVAQLLAEPEKL